MLESHCLVLMYWLLRVRLLKLLLVYQICEILNPTNCDTATVSVTVTTATIDAVADAGTL
jgi:hypothetical protein